eukprot:Mycagemm_TRINITY_DN10174_c0_g2::TRINITY_DN10174_c0_g2_i1::g.5193::m.5193 type:complete len:159 gc:universal TRINITY_DN10174_c0_g2_i1:1290-814(-)
MVVFASINLVKTPPNVSIPNDKGITSNKRTSFTSPVNTPPWIAAPTATASSGLTFLEGFLPKNFSTSSCTLGIRVEPPTRITSLISLLVYPAFFIALLQGSIILRNNESASCSNFARVKVRTRCFGIPSTGNIYGKLISVCVELDSSTFAFSAASFKR